MCVKNLQNDVALFVFWLRPQTEHDMADLWHHATYQNHARQNAVNVSYNFTQY